ncbi:hypothetical protein KN815_11695 [Streptomyces sp. 4503]|uniref:Uncharacterized protein n=1 Tax=Streptomyces niphimycinicus TaxID=2842201 RepID=A0ABS6CCV8_9ACTN|nr:hypothetical protein [Streptomyces niphimycinicus]MBU3864718.1 hypothetical protein [Streptomyces niphimycinicus]
MPFSLWLWLWLWVRVRVRPRRFERRAAAHVRLLFAVLLVGTVPEPVPPTASASRAEPVR